VAAILFGSSAMTRRIIRQPLSINTDLLTVLP
jgi:hypothetical protein